MTHSVGAAPPAATIVLLREVDGRLQALLTKRSAGLSFMAGLWVFPGGRMEADDAAAGPDHVDPAGLEHLRGRMLDRDGTPLPPSTALGLYVAGCRETFEESGVLLARPRGATPQGSVAWTARVATARAQTTTAAAFLELLEREDLVLELDRLVYWAHWITPSAERKRFDTRFFVVQVPASQEASVDRGEVTQHAWLDEQEITAHLRTGEMKMVPPTIATLQDLWRSHARHGRLAAMLEAEAARPVPPILPKAVRTGDALEVVMPWDAEYAGLPGEGCATWPAYPEHLATLPSRRSYRL
jgi:8-oxo-dGTP pyrophosphatase MutT (NUDIX family)